MMPSTTASGSVASVASVPMTNAVRMLFKRLVQHVVAGEVGAEHVVVAHQASRRRRQQRRHRAASGQRHAPRDRRLAAPDAQPGRRAPALAPPGATSSAISRPHSTAAAASADQQAAARRAARQSPAHCAAGSLRCAPPCSSRGATRVHLAVDLDRLLGEADGRPAAASRWSRAIAPGRAAARRAATACACRRPRCRRPCPPRAAARRGSARCRASVITQAQPQSITDDASAGASGNTLRQLARQRRACAARASR